MLHEGGPFFIRLDLLEEFAVVLTFQCGPGLFANGVDLLELLGSDSQRRGDFFIPQEVGQSSHAAAAATKAAAATTESRRLHWLRLGCNPRANRQRQSLVRRFLGIFFTPRRDKSSINNHQH